MRAPARATVTAGCVMACFVAGAAATPRAASACTTFLLERGGQRLVGKSYDWMMGQGMVLVNKRGVAKQSLVIRPGDAPARWVSRHASVTFNQYGRELPNGGMNDAGLVVEVMWLDSSTYERQDERPSVNELQWIQLQLDSFATVAEMTAAAARLRVSPAYAKVHYLACDRAGACAAFEHVDGKLVVTPGAKVLTNNTYAESAAYAARNTGATRGAESLERFARTSRAVSAPAASGGSTAADPVAAAFAILDGVRGPESQWNIVYDPVHLRAHFRTRASPRVKWIDLGGRDPSCAADVLTLDIDDAPAGDVSARLRPYRDADNRRLVERGVRDIRARLPPGAVDLLAAYPRALACTAP